LPLTNKYLAKLDIRTFKEAQDDHDESAVSVEHGVTIKRFKRNLLQNE
jgi:hypothetical protein